MPYLLQSEFKNAFTNGQFNLKKHNKKFLKNLLAQAKNTSFGKDHNFDSINSYQDFKKQVPVRDYEALKPYVDKIKEGKNDVLWKGKTFIFC